MIWQTKKQTFDLSLGGLVMGVLNVTTDSFSDGGNFIDFDRAVAHGCELAAAGAAIIDIGGESTRPGAAPVAEKEELHRVIPVIERLALEAPRCVISIDTMKPAVAEAAVAAGAGIINDVTGLRDVAMRDVVKRTGAGAIAMHMQGNPRDMQQNPRYDNVVSEIRNFFRQTFEACLACGIDPMSLAFDPGIGFGKTVEHNLALLRNLEPMRVEKRPVVLGVSRKSFLGKIIGSDRLEDRSWPTVALTSYGRARGADIFRVHEVRSNDEALRMTEAILNPEASA